MIGTKAVRCTKAFLPQEENQMDKKTVELALDVRSDEGSPFSLTQQIDDSSDFLVDFDIGELFISGDLNSDFLQFFGAGVQ